MMKAPGFLVADMRNTGLPAGKFQRIYSAYSAFMYRNPREFVDECMKEAERLLAPDGYLLLFGGKGDFDYVKFLPELFAKYGLELVEDRTHLSSFNGLPYGHFLVHKPAVN